MPETHATPGSPASGEGGASTAPRGELPRELLELLVCPLGLAPLRQVGNALVCTKCGLAYPINEDGFAVMLVEEAKLPDGITELKQLPCFGSKRC